MANPNRPVPNPSPASPTVLRTTRSAQLFPGWGVRI
jgi:hypothetical protein